MTKLEVIVDCLINVFIKITDSVKEHSHPAYSKEIHACINYIEKHLHEKLTIERISTAMGYSKSWLPRKFKNETGTALPDYKCPKRLKKQNPYYIATPHKILLPTPLASAHKLTLYNVSKSFVALHQISLCMKCKSDLG